MKIYLFINPGNGAVLRYAGNGRSDTNEHSRERRHPQKKKGDRKPRGGNSEPEKYSDPSASDGINHDDDRDDNPDWKKARSHCRRTKKHKRESRRDGDFDPGGFSGDQSATLSGLSSQSSGQCDPNSDDGELRRRESRSKLRVTWKKSLIRSWTLNRADWNSLRSCWRQKVFPRTTRA